MTLGKTIRIGIDLGGTKTEAIALDHEGRILARHRAPSPKDDYQATVATIADLVARLQAETGKTGTVGVGIPGAISPASGLVKNANSTWLIGRPLQQDLEAALNRPVRIANDANCFAVSEATDGAAEGKATVFGVILGTGVGGGIVINGEILTGPDAIAGEWGHNPLPWPTQDERPGPMCYCGKQGCIETFLSGPGLSGDYERNGGGTKTPQDIVGSAAADQNAQAALNRYAERLARSLATVINIINPDAIVLGGGLSNMDYLYESVTDIWQQWVFSDTTVTPLIKNQHGDSSGVRGAAWLWPTG